MPLWLADSVQVLSPAAEQGKAKWTKEELDQCNKWLKKNGRSHNLSEPVFLAWVFCSLFLCEQWFSNKGNISGLTFENLSEWLVENNRSWKSSWGFQKTIGLRFRKEEKRFKEEPSTSQLFKEQEWSWVTSQNHCTMTIEKQKQRNYSAREEQAQNPQNWSIGTIRSRTPAWATSTISRWSDFFKVKSKVVFF